jgi:hypothetical protein
MYEEFSKWIGQVQQNYMEKNLVFAKNTGLEFTYNNLKKMVSAWEGVTESTAEIGEAWTYMSSQTQDAFNSAMAPFYYLYSHLEQAVEKMNDVWKYYLQQKVAAETYEEDTFSYDTADGEQEIQHRREAADIEAGVSKILGGMKLQAENYMFPGKCSNKKFKNKASCESSTTNQWTCNNNESEEGECCVDKTTVSTLVGTISLYSTVT